MLFHLHCETRPSVVTCSVSCWCRMKSCTSGDATSRCRSIETCFAPGRQTERHLCLKKQAVSHLSDSAWSSLNGISWGRRRNVSQSHCRKKVKKSFGAPSPKYSLGWRPSLVCWRTLLLGWRPLLLCWRALKSCSATPYAVLHSGHHKSLA